MKSTFTTPRSYFTTPMTTLSVITLIATFVGLSHEIMYLRSCSIRYEIAKFLNHTCEEVRRYQPMCRRTIKVSYSELAPYIFKNETGYVSGLFPGILFILNEIEKSSKNCQYFDKMYNHMPERVFRKWNY